MTAHYVTINSPPVEYVVFKTQEERSSSFADEQQWTSKGANSVIHTTSIGALLLSVICWELQSMGQFDFVLTGMKLLGVSLLCMLAMIPNQSKPISPASRKMKLLFIYSCSWIVFLDFGWDFWISRVRPKMSTYSHDDTCVEKKAQDPEEIILLSRFENMMGDHFLDDAPFRDTLSLLHENNICAIASKVDATFLSAEIPTNHFELSLDTGLQHEDTSVKKAVGQCQGIIHQWQPQNRMRWNVLDEATAAEIQVSKALAPPDDIADEADDNDTPSLKIQASRPEPRSDTSSPHNGSFRDHNEAPINTLSVKMSELLRLIELHYIAGDNSMIFIPLTVGVMLGIDARSMPGIQAH